MHRLLLEDEEFRALDMPLSDENYAALDYLIKKDLCQEPVTVWKDYIIEGYERYRLYQKYHHQYGIREETIGNRKLVIIWICQHQLERHDLNGNAVAWLLYRLYEAEHELEKYYAGSDASPVNESGVWKHICAEYGISTATLTRYVAFGKHLDQLENAFPGVRVRILSGRLEVARAHMKELLKLPEPVLRRMIDDPECCRLALPKRKKKDAAQLRVVPPVPDKLQLGIKRMPAYDPDAQLNGLTFTVGSWEKAVLRVRERTDFRTATAAGKQRLQQALTGLITEVNELNHMLEVDFNE